MILRKFTSILLSTTMILEPILPTFAMEREEFRAENNFSFNREGSSFFERQSINEIDLSKKKVITKIKNLSEIDIAAGVVIQPGDWLVLDIDDTVLKGGKGSNEDVLNLDPKFVKMVKNWQALNAQEGNPLKHITIVVLTARKLKNEEKTKAHLKKIGFPENIEVIFAPNDRQLGKKTPTKGAALMKRLEGTHHKPRRLVIIDDLEENLMDIHTAHRDSQFSRIPLKLLQRETRRKIYQSSNSGVDFSVDLRDLTYDSHIEGGSGGVHILKNRDGQRFTLKSAGNSEQMKEEIVADALYRSLGVPVPAFAVYDYLPDIVEIKEASLGPGPYRLAPLIEGDEKATKEIVAQKIRKHFVTDALLSNFDIVVGGFKNVVLDKDGTLWRIDNGGSLRYRARGESKFDLKDWNAHDVPELESMRNAVLNPDGAFAYESLTKENIKQQVHEILANKDALFKALEDVSKALHLTNPSEVREMLRRRLDSLAQKYLLTPQKEGFYHLDGFMASQFGAGILVHSIDPRTHEPVILMGKRRGHNWWCNFGGKSDLDKGPDSDKTLADTAAREVQEESLGNLSFTAQELKRTPSHAILNSGDVFYRMFIASHPYIDIDRFQKAEPVDSYGWHHEYSEYRWISLQQLINGLDRQESVEEEKKKTLKVDDMILYPYFVEMLEERKVRETLTAIYRGQKVLAKHTHDGKAYVLSAPLSLEEEKESLAETIVKKGFVLGEIKALQKDQNSSFDTPPDIQRMSGFLTNHEAASISKALLDAPYTQTQAHLRYVMGESYEPGASEQEVGEFLYNYAKLHLNPYTIQIQDSHENLKENEIGVFLKEGELYFKIKNKEDFKIEILDAIGSEGKHGLRRETYNSLKDAVSKSNDLGYAENEEALEYAIRAGYARQLPIDPHYIKTLTEALNQEKANKHKAVFYHATDPLTCFLWDIFTAYRSRLKNRGVNEIITLRGLEKGFGSILDVEAFINAYKDASSGCVHNYTTVNSLHYADLALSVNPFLFGNDANYSSATYYLFHNVKSISPTQQEKLFNAFMSTVGIPGKFKDYKAIFQQYCQKNSKLFQIFINPQVVDTVSYMAVAGGDVVTLEIDNGKPYHGFANILPEAEINPIKFNERMQKRISGRIHKTRNINDLQGRLFLNPKIFHEPEYVTINTYWRYPLDAQEIYYQKLNAQVAQDLGCWLPQHCHLDDKTFVEGTTALQKLYRYAYEGQMSLTYGEKGPQFFLSTAIKDGNVEIIKEIFEKNPEIDLNKGFQCTDYRDYRKATISPLGLLKIDTPHFEEIVKIFIGKGLNTIDPRQIDASLRDKLLNELVLYQDSLEGDLRNWFEPLWNNLKARNSWGDVSSLLEKGHSNLFSAVLGEIPELDARYVDQKKLSLLVNSLRINKSLKGLKGDEWTLKTILNLLFCEKEDSYKEAPWFKGKWQEILADPTAHVNLALRHREFSLASAILRDTKVDTIELALSHKEDLAALTGILTSNEHLRTLRVHDYGGLDYAWLEALLKEPFMRKNLQVLDFSPLFPYGQKLVKSLATGLKDNGVLKDLILDEDDQTKWSIVRMLMGEEGVFWNAPWHQEIWRNARDNPQNVLQTAFRNKNYPLFCFILKIAPQEIPLGKLKLSHDSPLFSILAEELERNERFASQSLNLGGLWGDPKAISTFANALKKNNTIKSLTLSLSLNSHKALSEGLKENATLENLTLTTDTDMSEVLSVLMCEEGQFRRAPWFKRERDKFYASSQSLEYAISRKNWPLVTDFIRNTTIRHLDFSKLNMGWLDHRDQSQWSQAMIEGLKDNSTLQELALSDHQMFEIMKDLMSLCEERSFTSAPWFQKARKGILEDSWRYLDHFYENKNYAAMFAILKDAPKVPLGRFINDNNFSQVLSQKLLENEPYSYLNLYGIGDDAMALLAKALKDNTVLKVLDFSDSSLSKDSIKSLAQGLKDNKTVETLLLSENQMMDLLKFLMKEDQESSFRDAPWFKTVWETIIASPEESSKEAISSKNYEVARNVIAATKAESLNWTKVGNDMSSMDFVIEGLRANTTIQKINVGRDFNDVTRMEKLISVLQDKKTIMSLELEASLSEDVARILGEGLKTNDSLKELRLPWRSGLHVLNMLCLHQDPLSEGVKAWVDCSIQDILSDAGNMNVCLEKKYGESSLTNLISLIFGKVTEVTLKYDNSRFDVLSQELKKNQTISRLELELPNFWYVSSFSSLTDLLKGKMGVVKELSLCTTYKFIDINEIRSLVDAFVENQKLETLDLSQVSLNAESVRSLEEVISAKKSSKIIKLPGKNFGGA